MERAKKKREKGSFSIKNDRQNHRKLTRLVFEIDLPTTRQFRAVLPWVSSWSDFPG